MSHRPYIGRFAPSPSGDLHFGSLIAAVGSYLQAKSQHGRWLVRIEDIDPPREIEGAAAKILTTLEHYGLHWDDKVLYQSTRLDAYRDILASLSQANKSYYCTCSRHDIQQQGGYYNGHCRTANNSPHHAAIRLKQTQPVYSFNDQLSGLITVDRQLAEEDFIIHRRDGLFAYNLAVVVDDHEQNITEIVRGADLITATVRQISLYQHLGWSIPDYLHLPLALANNGQKLSKQNHAPELTLAHPQQTLAKALQFLGQPLPVDWQDASTEQLLHWATQHWSVNSLTKPDLELFKN